MALAGLLGDGLGKALSKAGGSALADTGRKALGNFIGNEAIKVAPTALSTILTKASTTPPPASDMMRLYRGLSQKYDPNYPVNKLDTSGYESFTDSLDLARKYGDNVYSIDVPKSDIKTSYLDENPLSPTYGDRNPIYSIDKKAGLDGVSGNEYLLEVGSDYQKGLEYNLVSSPEVNKYFKVPVEKSVSTEYTGVPVRVGNAERVNLNNLVKNPMELYHQTSSSSLAEMTPKNARAVAGDADTPSGIFLKETDDDIGLAGKNQLRLNADIRNPLKAYDRSSLNAYAKMRSPRQAELLAREKEIDEVYGKANDEIDAKISSAYEDYYYDKTPEKKAILDELQEQQRQLMDGWSSAIEENATRAREGFKNVLTNNGYDGVILENDMGSGGRSVKSYIALDKGQLSEPGAVAKPSFKSADEIFEASSPLVDNLKSILDKTGLDYEAGQKSIGSMNKKVARKLKAGKEYGLMDMKDHVRGAVKMADFSDDSVRDALERIEYALGDRFDIENLKSELGYNGVHLTWRDTDTGLGYEVQLTTPEHWKVKKASDAIYNKWRDLSDDEIMSDPKLQLQHMNDRRESVSMWKDLWRMLGFDENGPDLSWVEDFLDDVI